MQPAPETAQSLCRPQTSQMGTGAEAAKRPCPCTGIGAAEKRYRDDLVRDAGHGLDTMCGRASSPSCPQCSPPQTVHPPQRLCLTQVRVKPGISQPSPQRRRLGAQPCSAHLRQRLCQSTSSQRPFLGPSAWGLPASVELPYTTPLTQYTPTLQVCQPFRACPASSMWHSPPLGELLPKVPAPSAPAAYDRCPSLSGTAHPCQPTFHSASATSVSWSPSTSPAARTNVLHSLLLSQWDSCPMSTTFSLAPSSWRSSLASHSPASLEGSVSFSISSMTLNSSSCRQNRASHDL